MPKRRLSLRILFAMLAILACVRAVSAQNAVVGVNVINPYILSVDVQDQTLAAIRAAGVTTIRASITLDDKGIDFAERAQKHGLKIEWLIYRFGNYNPFGTTPLSAADPAQFRSTFQSVLNRLEDKGIVLAAFELGNEINLSGTNPEFVQHPGRARQLSPADLQNDPEGQKIAAGYLQYLKLLSVLKDIRDHSRLNQHTPIMTAGLGTYDQEDGPLPGWAKGDVVSINTTLRFMRAHGLDKLVDAYAVHIYPDTKHPRPDAAAQRKQIIAKYDLAECARPGSAQGKPCWVTEWGIDNTDHGCPLDDGARAQMMAEIMGDFRPYVRDGRVAGLVYFAWSSTPPEPSSFLGSGIFRCGALTEAGRTAVDAGLLK